MKEFVKKVWEFEGSDIEEAVEKALDFLKVSRDEIIVKIVCEEKKGLFGMVGGKLAKIKVSLKPQKNNNIS
ncbi:MAG TPA: Jag N-terminal domain-containing protein [Candidatus Omnitrophota bacterium]|nr:Jag N-terminal domain-containing protein [Candidatus Omnitrophota bacterium]HPN87932.1 Jag N-terminal domain-containing protein [Candidatus Omnitrophota bacterium]